MTQSVSILSFPPAISIKVEISALSPDQKRAIVFDILRDTGIAYVPELKDAIEDISVALNSYVNPAKPIVTVSRR